jgi:hypothetical protein
MTFFGFSRVQVEGEDALDLGSGGPTARFIIAQRNRYTIVCDELDAEGHRIGRGRYVQIVESQDQADERDRLQQYMQHADAAVGKITADKQVGLRAVYLNRETGERVPMQLYAGPSASDPHRIVLVDLLPGIDRIEYGGATIQDALGDFENGNAYPVGSIQLEVPANRSGLPTLSRQIVTSGESLWQTWSHRIGWASLGLVAAGVVAAAVGAEPVAAAFFIAAAGTGVASGGLSLYDRLQKAEPSPVGIALDVAGIAASVVGGAAAFRALRVGTALTFTGATGRFLFYSGFATNAVSGLLITVEGVDEISRILGSQMPQGEKIGAIVRILANLVVQGSLLALSVRDTNQLRRRVAAMIGEEAAGALQVDILHSLNLLDDDALRALRGLPHDRLLVFAEIARTNPTSAARLAQVLQPGYLASLTVQMRERYEQLLTEIWSRGVTGTALEQRLAVLGEVASIRTGVHRSGRDRPGDWPAQHSVRRLRHPPTQWPGVARERGLGQRQGHVDRDHRQGRSRARRPHRGPRGSARPSRFHTNPRHSVQRTPSVSCSSTSLIGSRRGSAAGCSPERRTRARAIAAGSRSTPR